MTTEREDRLAEEEMRGWLREVVKRPPLPDAETARRIKRAKREAAKFMQKGCNDDAEG